jgi:hypothetical protein
MFLKNLKFHLAKEQEPPGKERSGSRTRPSGLESPSPLMAGQILRVILGTEITMTLMTMTPSTPKHGVSQPTTPHRGSCTASAVIAAAWAARAACSPTLRPSPTRPSPSICTYSGARATNGRHGLQLHRRAGSACWSPGPHGRWRVSKVIPSGSPPYSCVLGKSPPQTSSLSLHHKLLSGGPRPEKLHFFFFFSTGGVNPGLYGC